MKLRTLLIVSAFCLTTFSAYAGGKDDKKPSTQYDLIDFRHEVKIGIGGTAFERTYFPNSVRLSYIDRPSSATYVEKQNHKYIPHIYAEYYYTLLPWLSLGGQVDFSGFSWQDQYYHGGANLVYRTENQNCYNIVIQAMCRFNWLRREYWGLYSGIGLGTGINTGTEADPFGRKTLAGIAVTPVVIGIKAGAGHWFGTFEFSGLNSMKGTAQLFLVGGRLFSVSAGYKF